VCLGHFAPPFSLIFILRSHFRGTFPRDHYSLAQRCPTLLPAYRSSRALTFDLSFPFGATPMTRAHIYVSNLKCDYRGGVLCSGARCLGDHKNS